MTEKSNKIYKVPDGIEQIGFFSDLHGNDYNLSLMFNKHPEIEHWFCAGDAIDMFGKSWNNLPTLRKMLRKNVVSIYGNHEAGVLNNNQKKKQFEKEPKILSYLEEMPFNITIFFCGLIIDVFHATSSGVNDYLHPDAPLKGYQIKFNSLISDMVIVGHTHKQFEKKLQHLRIINPGALGLDENSYCIIDCLGAVKFCNLNNK